MKQTVLITGTSSGLGRATAKLFQRNGWNVVATMRRASDEAELDKLEGVFVHQLDLEDLSSIASAVAAGIDAFGRIDVVVNNAGFGAYGPLESTSPGTMQRQFQVNLFGPLQLIQAILPHFRANRSGTIVNVGSTGGRMAFPLGSLYHSSKFAIEGASEALQYELAPLGIRIKVVEPGAIRSDFSGRSLVFSNDPPLAEHQPLIRKVMAAYGSVLSSGSDPETIAEVVFTAASDDSGTLRYVAGEDGIQMIETRQATSDADLFAGIKANFGIEDARR